MRDEGKEFLAQTLLACTAGDVLKNRDSTELFAAVQKQRGRIHETRHRATITTLEQDLTLANDLAVSERTDRRNLLEIAAVRRVSDACLLSQNVAEKAVVQRSTRATEQPANLQG